MSVNLASSVATPPRHRHLALIACCLATFVLLAYTTVVTVGASAIHRDLDTGFAVDQWIIDAYNLALAALLLGAGHLGDRIGHRRVFLVGITVFTLASLACATATNGIWIVTARAVQGAGGAALLATAVPLLALGYQGRARTVAFAVWSATAGAGSTVGTIAGGVVTQYTTWRWLFLGAVPLCVTAAICGAASLPASARRTGRPDRAGPLAVTLSTAALTFAAIHAGDHGWLSAGTLAGLVVAIGAGAVFVGVERRASDPILPVQLFATPRFLAVALCGFAYYFGGFAILPAMSGWLQTSLGLRPVQAAAVLSVQLAAYIAVALLVSSRLHRAALRMTLAGGTAVTGLAGALGMLLFAHAGWTTLLLPLVIAGIGAAVVSPALPVAAAAAVPAAHTGTAGAAVNAIRQLGLTIGVAVCGALAHRHLGGADGAAHALSIAFAVAGAVALVIGLACVRPLGETPGTPG